MFRALSDNCQRDDWRVSPLPDFMNRFKQLVESLLRMKAPDGDKIKSLIGRFIRADVGWTFRQSGDLVEIEPITDCDDSVARNSESDSAGFA